MDDLSLTTPSPRPAGRTRWASRAATAGTFLLLFVLVLSARVRYTGSDARLNLLTAQALFETGSPRLDRYLTPEVRASSISAPWTIWTFEGHLYNLYPPGASLLALPAVAVARAAGLDMVDPRHDAALQVVLSALLVAGLFLVLERTARIYLSPGAAFGTSLAFVLGTSIASTFGTALWSHGPAALLSALALLHLVSSRSRQRDPDGLLLGLLLGGAFLCRPTAALPAILVFALLLARHRREALRFAVAGGAAVALLVAASFAVLGIPLPSYYVPRSWPVNAQPLVGLLGVLASPGRGLFAFSPFLLAGLAGWGAHRLRRDPLFLLASAWAALHVAVVARHADWWGGWSYGPRLLSDSLPAWFLLVVLSASWLGERLRAPLPRRLVTAGALAAVLFSVGVHAVQGLFNPATIAWNDRPNVYEAPREKLFDVTNPQFLATWERNQRAAERYYGSRPGR
jgi:hypothetical protein